MKTLVKVYGGFAVFGFVYLVGAEIGHALSFPGNFASIWPPAGVYFAALFARRKARWPGYLMAALLANVCSDVGFHGQSLLVSLGFWASNTCAAVMTAALLQRFVGPPSSLFTLRNIVIFIVSTVLSAGLAAGIAALVVVKAFGGSLISVWGTWCVSGSLGTLFVGPLKLALRRKLSPASLARIHWVELGIASLVTGAMAVYLFRLQSRPITYLPLLPVIWAAARQRVLGAQVSTGLLSIIAVWCTTHGYGPFATVSDVSEQIVLTQVYLSTVISVALLVSTLTIEREQAMDALESARNDAERHRLSAESANRFKSEFLASMSHEIRTPLTAIVGYADILRGIDGSATQQRDEAVDVIQHSGQHLLEMINDVLDISKIEAGKLTVSREVVSPREIAERAVSLLRGISASKGIALTTEYSGDIPEAIECDPIRLRQILVNLIGNAIKFTQRGSVRLRMSRQPEWPKTLTIEIIDTGVGIPDESLARLFQPYEQASESFRRNRAGTGLGLAISRQLARMLGGDLTASSQLEKGSSFVLTLPIIDRVPLRTESPAADPGVLVPRESGESAPRSLEGRRILVADDVLVNQRLIAYLLKKEGAEVVSASDGREALELARSAMAAGAAFDLILMDLQMPVMDGLTAVQNLRNEGFHGPIIALTAHAMLEARRACLDGGCNDFATKPINREAFLSQVRRWTPHREDRPGSQNSTKC